MTKLVKKVLIITYYWPPSGGAGVQRWLKFVKYLREFGWEPVVYTPQNPETPVPDLSLENEIPVGIQIIKQPIWEPYDIYKKFIGRAANIQLSMPLEGRRNFKGVIVDVSSADVLMRVENENFELPFAQIAKGKLMIEDKS